MIIKGHAPATRTGKINAVQKFMQWLEEQNMDELQVRYNDILAYVKTCKQKGNKPRTQQMQVEALKIYYDHLIALETLRENPCGGIAIKGATRRTLYHTFSSEELETLYKKYVNYLENIKDGIGTHATGKRNKIMTGLIFFQGLLCDELEMLTVHHVQLREGKITIPAGRKSNERELKLEPHQIYDMMDYVNETRKGILFFTGKKTDQLFLSFGTGERFSNMTHKILKQLHRIEPELKNLKHIRASVIANWLKVHDTRKVQYMAGHRYVSSTESYKANNIEDLITDVERYHPDI